MQDQSTRGKTDGKIPLVDCDLHVKLTEEDENEIVESLPEPFRRKGLSRPAGGYTSPGVFFRLDSYPDDAPPGSQPDLTEEQLLDEIPIEHAIITGGIGYQLVSHPNAKYAAEVCSAYNDWVLRRWTERDDRIHASISVTHQAPHRAVEEIERLADHPDMVQVITGSGTRTPLGQRDYWPIYEAAANAGLPMAVHVGPKGGVGIGHPDSPGGHPSNYTEAHIMHPANYYSQVASLVLEGVFEEFPDLTFVMIEGGFGWVPDLMNRLDQNWELFRDEVPWLTRPPSEYVKENVKFTTQPILEPPNASYFNTILEMMCAEETLLFSSDYPHWDGDYKPDVLFNGIDNEMKRSIFYDSAKSLYDF